MVCAVYCTAAGLLSAAQHAPAAAELLRMEEIEPSAGIVLY